ncbi:MAG: 30S ribosome-binding factor RbfA [Acidobacteriota bacterium]
MDELRSRRVAESMREELSELVRFELSDPRIQGVDIVDVIVSPDMRSADALVVISGTEAEQQAALEGLQAARHYLRRNLMQRIDLFRMPELRFRLAAQLPGGDALHRLKRRLRRGRPRE